MCSSYLAAMVLAAEVVAARASAGLVMQFERKQGSEAAVTGSIWIDGDRMRLEMGEGNSVIFRGDKQVMWILQPAEKSYMELTKDGMKQISSQMDAMKKQMEERMKDMPADQRAMIEKAMAGKMGGEGAADPAATSDEPKLKKTDRTETINGYPCTAYEQFRASGREQELWVTDYKRFGITAADLKAFASMAEFMKSMQGPMARRASVGFAQQYSDGDSPNSIPGVPIRIISTGPKGDTVQELKKLEHAEVPAAKFDLPEGYKKMDMTMGGPGMRPRGGDGEKP